MNKKTDLSLTLIIVLVFFCLFFIIMYIYYNSRLYSALWSNLTKSFHDNDNLMLLKRQFLTTVFVLKAFPISLLI